MGRLMLVIAIAFALIWTSTTIPMSATDSEGLFTYLIGMSPTEQDEMCEVWSQDRVAVLSSLHALNGATYSDAALVALTACSN